SHSTEKTQVPKVAVAHSTEIAVEKATPVQPPPDLLDLGEPTTTSAPTLDPFKQLEGLLDPTQATSIVNIAAAGATEAHDIMALYADTPASGESGGVASHLSTNRDVENLLSGLSSASTNNAHDGTTITQSTQISKGPNPKDSLEKDALVRQMGVNP